jgi:integrase/recombinase XerD
MSVTIKATLYTKKKRSDGQIPIYIRITKDRKSTYVTTGLYVSENDWNNKERQVRKTHRQYSLYNRKIADKLNELESSYLEIDTKQKEVDPQKLKQVIKPNANTDGVLHYIALYKEELKADNRFFEFKKIGTIQENLYSYFKGVDVPLNKLNSEFAIGFQDFLIKGVANNSNTIRRKITTTRGFITWLKGKKLVKADPFIGLKKPAETDTSKTRLTIEQIEAIESLDIKQGTSLWHTRNYFLYAFYNAGIRFGDICTLKWSNIVDGRLVYRMLKTNHEKSIKQTEVHESILRHYRPKKASPNSYIFPLIRKTHPNTFELKKEISSRNVIVNNNLKRIAKMAGIEAKVSFHVARHSFSQYALKKGLDLYSISKALGHTDIKITQEYLASFDEEILDKSMEGLFGKA